MSDIDVAAAYRSGRERVNELVESLTDAEANAPVPTCPGWTVHDVLAHVTGVCSDILAGNLAGVATDPWTAAQVEARRDRSMRELLDEWNAAAEQVEPIASAFPGRTGTQWLFDMATHEHDMRLAVGKPGGRNSDAVTAGVNFVVEVGLRPFVTVRGLGPLLVHAGDRAWVVGSAEPMAAPSDLDAATMEARNATLMGDSPFSPPSDTVAPVAELKVAPFDLFRAGTGRRSAAQIRALGWSGDPESYLPAFGFGPFTIAKADIVE